MASKGVRCLNAVFFIKSIWYHTKRSKDNQGFDYDKGIVNFFPNHTLNIL